MAKGDVNVVGTASSKGGGTNWKLIGAIIGVLVLALGVGAGIILVRQQQNIQEKADSSTCPAAEECAVTNTNRLLSCDSVPAGDPPTEYLCDTAGVVSVCGGAQWCCPEAGGNWTTNLSLCPGGGTPTSSPTQTATASAAATATATSTATSAATSTATATASATATAGSSATTAASSTASSSATPTSAGTPFPVPETGTSLPTILGVGLGILVIVGSLILAL